MCQTSYFLAHFQSHYCHTASSLLHFWGNETGLKIKFFRDSISMSGRNCAEEAKSSYYLPDPTRVFMKFLAADGKTLSSILPWLPSPTMCAGTRFLDRNVEKIVPLFSAKMESNRFEPNYGVQRVTGYQLICKMLSCFMDTHLFERYKWRTVWSWVCHSNHRKFCRIQTTVWGPFFEILKWCFWCLLRPLLL